MFQKWTQELLPEWLDYIRRDNYHNQDAIHWHRTLLSTKLGVNPACHLIYGFQPDYRWGKRLTHVADCGSEYYKPFIFHYPEFHCPKTPEVSHARHNVSAAKQQHGTTVKYNCDSGYVMEGSAGSIHCQRTTWVGTLPTCIPTLDVGQDPPETVSKLDENGEIWWTVTIDKEGVTQGTEWPTVHNWPTVW